ncbi:MAG TPA: hypothetical protein VFJ19_09310 [Nocardioidaceae bacterium]|nr:hypothetical protein [Nocardioidaceae bacterium]
MTCPQCGGTPVAVVADAQTAPWLCETCRRGWWPAELDHAAAWRPGTRDFPHDVRRVLLPVLKGQVAAAHDRGVSVDVSMLADLDPAQMDVVRRRVR